MKRASGVLMHISCLPGEFGIGALGENARKFADFLKDCGFSYWQILPVNELGEGYSPYKSPSAFAGNPWLIDLEELLAEELLLPDELSGAKQQSPYLCEFDHLKETRINLLKRAFSRIDHNMKIKIEKFKAKNPWVLEYANFMALKIENDNAPWQEWKILIPCEDEVDFYCFLQYKFFDQWENFKDYVNSIGVKIIGDMPIYVAPDSADVFSNKKFFRLNAKGEMLFEAGVPPDYFAEDGQAWGNPLYNWDALKKDGYAWYINRIRHLLNMFDMVRIDHFRGFSDYWAIPSGKKATKGKWEAGPGLDFFDKLKKSVAAPGIIAEDLGDIDERVVALLKATGFPGMRVFQFGFSGDPGNPHLPYNYVNNAIAYTGTHDNNTLLGWLWELTPNLREQSLNYCGFHGENWEEAGAKAEALRSIIRTLYQSSAGIVVLPIQDLCGFGKDTRMNTPGIGQGNWAFRITWEQIAKIDREWFLELSRLYGRE